MPSIRVSKELNQGVYYVTVTVKNWYYIFDGHNRWEILKGSIIYCQKEKGLKVYAYVFMLNHIHMIIESEDVSGFLRDFKKYTAYELMKNLKQTEPKVAELFETERGSYEIWRKTNMPKLIESEDFFNQKKEYIENNPVRKKYVNEPKMWRYSSANPSSEIVINDIE